MPGILYLVATPIGNYSDITLRALRILNEVDYIICEEFKVANKLLKFFSIDKILYSLNEHNEINELEEHFYNLLNGKNIALISDCGTPVFNDPGKLFISKCMEYNIKLEFIHGANSLLSAIVVSGFDISRFFFFGFLSPKKDMRRLELKKLFHLKSVVAFMDTPYRLKALLEDIKEIFKDRKIFVGLNLTTNSEKHLRGTANEIMTRIGDENIKEEFIIIIDKDYGQTN